MGLITGLSGQAKVSHILFEQAKIHTTDIASLYYYRALVNFHNERIEGKDLYRQITTTRAQKTKSSCDKECV